MNSSYNEAYRICHLKKLAEFNGYGFNLKSRDDIKCQFVGIVDEGSPAFLSGLKNGDRIIEINHSKATSLNYDQIVKLIKKGLDIDGKRNTDELLLVVENKISKSLKKKKKDATNQENSIRIEITKPEPDEQSENKLFREPEFLKNLFFDTNQREKVENFTDLSAEINLLRSMEKKENNSKIFKSKSMNRISEIEDDEYSDSLTIYI